MRISRFFLLAFSTLFVLTATFTGCESTDGGSTQTTTNVYYGVGFYDPWYYGHYDYNYDVVVTPPERPGAPPRPVHPIEPPPNRPIARPEQPIARPPPSVRPSPMPSIPSTPRAAPRMGGGGRRR